MSDIKLNHDQVIDKTRAIKRRKKYINYRSKKCRSKQSLLRPGISGFLVTCNNKEYECVREAYHILNELADKLYGSVAAAVGDGESGGHSGGQSGGECEDAERALRHELMSLQSTPKRFQQVITNCNNVLFIQCNDKLIDPLLITYELLREIETNAKQMTKHLLRLVPIITTCGPKDDNFDKLIESVLKEQNDCETTYMIQCKVRNNSDVKRLQMIEKVVAVVKTVQPKWSVSFESPKLTIVVEIVHKVCCISIVNDYYHFMKYNLLEFAKKVNTNNSKNLVETSVGVIK